MSGSISETDLFLYSIHHAFPLSLTGSRHIWHSRLEHIHLIRIPSEHLFGYLFIHFNIGSNLSQSFPFTTFSEDQLKFLLSQVVCNKRKEAELQVAKWMFDSLSLEQAFDLACHNNNVQVNHFEQELVFCWVVTRSQILLTFTNISDIYIFLTVSAITYIF